MTDNNKESLLKKIADAAEQKLVTRKEVVAAYTKGHNKTKMGTSETNRSHILTEVFSSIGGGIIILGIGILVSEQWRTLSSFNKIILTFGAGIVAYVMGLLFARDNRVGVISSSFFLISALLIPFGIGVTLDVLGYNHASYGYYTVVSGLALLIFGCSYYVFRREFFLLFSILYATWFFYAFINLIYTGSNSDFNIYCTIIVSITYILLGVHFDNGKRYSLTGFLYGFGSVGLLGSLFMLDILHERSIYEWSFPFFLVALTYLSVRFKSNAFLTFNIIFLILWIMLITNRYFSQSLGWPIALVLTGLILIGVAFLYLQIRRKYFKQNEKD